jgi:hypothetical protein
MERHGAVARGVREGSSPRDSDLLCSALTVPLLRSGR